MQAAGQVASAPLFSSEEFGYGGQRFGRAFDPSEITGDHGVAAGLELFYTDFPRYKSFEFMPFAFVDMGKVWNEDAGVGSSTAASAGFGLNVTHPKSGISASVGMAWPLIREVESPLHGNGSSPRAYFQLRKSFATR